MKRLARASLAAGFGFSLTLLALPAQADTYSFRVKHEHTFGSCAGKLVISEQDIRYQTDSRSDARIWLYPQIKRVERKGLRNLIIHTYEDQSWQFGRDKPFEFHFLDGVVSNEVFNFVVVRVGRPAQAEATASLRTRYELAAKHLHTFGGCEGTLKITDTHIEYVSMRQKDSRLWKYLDIKQVRSSSAFDLTIASYEDQVLQFGRDKDFNFQLKEPLQPQVLEFIRSQMYR
ncbi:MAG: hypothetical protein HY653_05045 [Acidobacteria bacterium]|nr:hypothetical protein [Acidobacteriota bacterium]